ncbi:MAG: hypothetical protein N2505_00195 [Endomicrobia bacterium]|nr:hypothetical protein [Endomicrobiia bacterium]
MIEKIAKYIIQNNKPIVGFTGHAGSGKTYNATKLANVLLQTGCYVELISFSSFLKQFVYKLTNMTKHFGNKKINYQLLEHLPENIRNEILYILESKNNIREIYQFIGTEILRKENKDFHVEIVKKYIRQTNNSFNIFNLDFPMKVIIIDDVRFVNEAKFIKENNGIIVKVERKINDILNSLNIKKQEYNKVLQHESEQQIKLIEYDFSI